MNVRIVLPFTGLAIALALLTGCAGGATPGSPVPTGSTVSPGSTAVIGSTGTTNPTKVSYDTAASSVLIEVTQTVSTVAGLQGTDRTVLYGDGRIVQSSTDKSGQTSDKQQQHLSAAEVQLAVNQAAALRGTPEPGPQVSDVGSTNIKISVGGPTTSVRMGDVPGGVTVDPADGKARAAIGKLLDRLGA